MLRPPTESMELNRSISLYLREITASMFWKIVFSFSAEFLKSSGHNDVRKKAACFCHMFSWGDERWSSRVFSVGWWVEKTTEAEQGKWKRQPTASGRGLAFSSTNELSAILRTHQICISEYHTDRCRSVMLHNHKLSVHGHSIWSTRPLPPLLLFTFILGNWDILVIVQVDLIWFICRRRRALCKKHSFHKVHLQ